MTNLIIRRFTASDKDQWNMLWQGYNTFYKRSIELRVSERTWVALLENRGEPFGFAAELDGKVVGFTHYFFVRSTSDWGPPCYLQDLFAQSDIRGKGIGKALIEAVYADADKHDAAQTYWLTDEANATARKLYDHVANKSPFIKYQR